MILFFSCTVMQFACATEYAYSNRTELSAKSEDRKVVEFERFQNLTLNNIQSRVKLSKEIEFIIGGQSKDGVAKRVQLKINNLAD